VDVMPLEGGGGLAAPTGSSSAPFGRVGSNHSGGRINSDGVGNPADRFVQITKPGPLEVQPLPGGGTRITGDSVGGGKSNIRFNRDGTVRVDSHPPKGSTCPRITEHWN